MVGVKRGVGVAVVGARRPRRGVDSGIERGLVQTVVGVEKSWWVEKYIQAPPSLEPFSLASRFTFGPL